MVICLERGADLRMGQLMPLPLTVSCFSKIQIGFTFLVPAHLGGLGKRAVKRVSVSDRNDAAALEDVSRSDALSVSVRSVHLCGAMLAAGSKQKDVKQTSCSDQPRLTSVLLAADEDSQSTPCAKA